MSRKPLSKTAPYVNEAPEVLGIGLPTPTTFRSPREDGTRFKPHNGKYTPAIARKICEKIMQGKTLDAICKEPNMPNLSRVTKWLASAHNDDFREMYYYARRVQAELLVDEIITIADDSQDDWIKTYDKKGNHNGYKPDHECIQRSRVRIDTRKWLAAKLLPRIYGENIQIDHGVTGDLAKILEQSTNNDNGLPEPIEGEAKKVFK